MPERIITGGEGNVYLKIGDDSIASDNTVSPVNSKSIVVASMIALAISRPPITNTDFVKGYENNLMMSANFSENNNIYFGIDGEDNMLKFLKRKKNHVFKPNENSFDTKSANIEEKLNNIIETMATKDDLITLSENIDLKISNSAKNTRNWILTSLVIALLAIFGWMVNNPSKAINILQFLL